MTPWISLILLLPACAETLIPEAEPLPQDAAEPSLNVAVPGPSIDTPPPREASFDLTGGSTVQLSGETLYEGEVEGTILLQFLRERDDQPVELLHSETMEAPGSFVVQAPADIGPISAVAFLDRNRDGMPSPEDLGGRLDVEVGGQSIDSVRIAIGDIRSLGSLIPGQLMPGTGTIDGPMVQMEDHPATVDPPPADDMDAPQAPNVPRSLETATIGDTPSTDHPPVGGVAPPPDSVHAQPRTDGETP